MRSSKIIQELRQRSKPENRKFVEKNLDISREVEGILKEKELTQKEFAEKLDKNESEISKWLSGLHNLTLKSITKMEAVLDRDIIMTCGKARQQYQIIRYIPFIAHFNSLEALKEMEEPKEQVKFDEKCSYSDVA